MITVLVGTKNCVSEKPFKVTKLQGHNPDNLVVFTGLKREDFSQVEKKPKT